MERQFGVRYSRVYLRKIAVELGLLERMARSPRAGGGRRKSALDSEALSWVAATLKHSPRLLGFDADRWNNARLREAIERKFGIRYSRRYAWQIASEFGLSHLLVQTRT